MKHRSLHPNGKRRDGDDGVPRKPASRPARPKPAPPNLLSQSDPGPRPISARQQEARGEATGNRLTGRDIIDRTVPPRAQPAAPPPARSWREGKNRRHIRDTETTHIRRRKGEEAVAGRNALRNRRRVDYPRICLRVALGILCLEAIAAALFSSRFTVTEADVVGNETLATAALRKDLGVPAKANLFRLPVGHMRAHVLAANPALDTAEIHRSLPGTIRLVVKERKPWASVRLPDGNCYTIDAKLVPFRVSGEPEKGLPRLELSPGEPTEAAAPAPPVALGKPLKAPGLLEVSSCLTWAAAHNFPLDSVAIAPQGELCLNRAGGVQVQLGKATDLEKKLNALSLLLDRKPELRTGTDIATVNLYAPDAPAILPRSAVPAPASNANAPDDSAAPDAAAHPDPSRSTDPTGTDVRP